MSTQKSRQTGRAIRPVRCLDCGNLQKKGPPSFSMRGLFHSLFYPSIVGVVNRWAVLQDGFKLVLLCCSRHRGVTVLVFRSILYFIGKMNCQSMIGNALFIPYKSLVVEKVEILFKKPVDLLNRTNAHAICITVTKKVVSGIAF